MSYIVLHKVSAAHSNQRGCTRRLWTREGRSKKVNILLDTSFASENSLANAFRCFMTAWPGRRMTRRSLATSSRDDCVRLDCIAGHASTAGAAVPRWSELLSSPHR